nr:acyl carrier protein [uncultured Tolumonas sp.]
MNNPILHFICDALNSRSPLKLDGNALLTYRYLDAKHLDSFGLIQFIVEIEDEFDIELTPEDTQSDEFRYVGGLVELISRKVKNG